MYANMKNDCSFFSVASEQSYVHILPRVYILRVAFEIAERRVDRIAKECARNSHVEIANWLKTTMKTKIEKECRTACAIFSQVWRTSRHNRLAKCGTPADRPPVSILMVIGQPSFARFYVPACIRRLFWRWNVCCIIKYMRGRNTNWRKIVSMNFLSFSK